MNFNILSRAVRVILALPWSQIFFSSATGDGVGQLHVQAVQPQPSVPSFQLFSREAISGSKV